MSGNDRLTNQKGIRSTDQEHENGPPGGASGMSGGYENPDVQNWQGQQQATALKERQDADLDTVEGVASKIDQGGGTFEKT